MGALDQVGGSGEHRRAVGEGCVLPRASGQGSGQAPGGVEAAHQRSAFLVSSSVILLLTGFAKCLSVFGRARILEVSDPLLVVSNRHVMVFVGVLECVIAMYVLLGRSALYKYSLLLWLACGFSLYRFGLYLIGGSPGRGCPCLGTLTGYLGLSARTTQLVLSGIVAYLLIGAGSYFIKRYFEAMRVAGHAEGGTSRVGPRGKRAC